MPEVYEVQSGDSLIAIAERYPDMDFETIAQANGIEGPDYVIRPGQTLHIPDTIGEAPGWHPPMASNYVEDEPFVYAPLMGPQLFGNNDPDVPHQECREDDTIPPCCLLDLSVRCGHTKRSFVLKPPATSLIQVLGNSSDEETIEITLGGGPCNKGKPTGSGGSKVLTAPGDGVGKYPTVKLYDVRGLSPFKVKLPATPPSGVPLLIADLLSMFGDDPEFKSYSGSVTACEGGDEFDFTVEVFPLRKWNGSVSVGYEIPMETEVVQYASFDGDGNQITDQNYATIYKPKTEGHLAFTGDIGVTFGSQTSKIALPEYQNAQSGGAVFDAVNKFFRRSLPNMNAFLSNEFVTITLTPPKLEFGGELEYAEHPTAYDVGSSGKVFLRAQPLLGLKGATDILTWIIFGCGTLFGSPATGRALAKLKAKAEEGIGGGRVGGKFVAKVMFSVGGQISGGLEYAFVHGGTNTVTGSFKGEIPMNVDGELSIEIRVLFVGVSGGVTLAAATGVSGTLKAEFVGKDPGFSGFVEFKGLTIKSAAYYSVGGSKTGRKAPPSSGSSAPWSFNGARTSSREDHELLNIEVFKPAKWPDDSSGGATSLAKGT